MRAGRPGNSRGAAWASLPRCNPWGTAGRGPHGVQTFGPALRMPCQTTRSTRQAALAHAWLPLPSHGQGTSRCWANSASASLRSSHPPHKTTQPHQPITHFLFPSPSFFLFTTKKNKVEKKKKKRFFLISSAPSSKAKKDLLFFFGIGDCSLSDSHKDHRATTQEKLKKIPCVHLASWRFPRCL